MNSRAPCKNPKELFYLNQLLHAKGLGRARICQLIGQYGSAEGVIETGLDRKLGVLFGKWVVDHKCEQDLEEAEKAGVKLVSYSQATYPKKLLTISDYPLLLYVKGSLPSEDPCLALIGTRNASLYGKQAAQKLAKELAGAGAWIISGLARGIDTSAHLGALEGNGKTIAVIGSGLGHIYPQENQALSEKISNAGAIISEYPMDTHPAKGLFPRRNRIISGMSHAVCLVESPLEGGGMLTMRLAEKQGCPLFALPGRIDWPTFEGNHALIRENKAQLATKGDDLLKVLNIIKNQLVKDLQLPLLSREEKLFLDQMPGQEKSIEELVLLTQLPIMQLNVFLTRLILKKVVKEFPGKIYKKVTW